MTKKNMLQASLMTEIASLYYEKHLTQEEIGEKLFLSRSKVSRFLKKAEEVGIVEIRINHVLDRAILLEEKIKQQYHIERVFIYNATGRTEQEIQQGVSELAARYIEEKISHKMVIGVSWGNTVLQTINQIEPAGKFPIDVVQIMGAAATTNLMSNGDNIANKLATKYGGLVYNLNAPLFVDTDVKAKLEQDPFIRRTLSMAARADMILTSIGTLMTASDSNPWIGYITKDMFEEIKMQGAIGCIGARFFDENGNDLSNQWNSRCIGIELEDLRQCKDVTIIATGSRKAGALRGALMGHFANTLIIDSHLAQEIVF